MGRAHSKTVEDRTYVSIMCEGCGHPHSMPVRGQLQGALDRPSWEFDENLDFPTIRPSLLVNKPGEHHHPGSPVCHSWITKGRIQYLADSTHELAGKTIDLPEYPERWT